MGIGLALALVIDEDRECSRVDPRKDRALGVVIVIGRGIACEPPHDIGRAPSQLQSAGCVLRLRHHGERAAHRLVDIGHRIQTERDQRADALADLQGGEAFGRPFGLHRLIDACDPSLDHRHRQTASAGISKGQPRHISIAAGHLGRGDKRGLVPAIEDRGSRNVGRERDAQLVERQVGKIGGRNGFHIRELARNCVWSLSRRAWHRRRQRPAS